MSEIFFTTNVKMVKPKKTKLNYIWYDQINFKSLTTVDSVKTGGFCFPTNSVWFQKRDLLCKGKQTFDYFDSLYNQPMTNQEFEDSQL